MIQIICPAKVETGGTEALHQLAAELMKHADTEIVYVGGVYPDTPRKFRKYHASIGRAIRDIEGDTIILPEIYAIWAPKFKHAKICIWWLSVNNANASMESYSNKFIHLAQSCYAAHHLEQMGLKPIMVTDYIMGPYVNKKTIRKDLILFNPKKGFERTAEIIRYSRGTWAWQPIQGLNETEICKLMNKAKVYIDLGNHPGRDRIPREAAKCGCCVITNRMGAAGYEGDVPIPEQFKISKFDDAIARIDECIDDYEDNALLFAEYVAWVDGDKKRFAQEAAELLEVIHGN